MPKVDTSRTSAVRMRPIYFLHWFCNYFSVSSFRCKKRFLICGCMQHAVCCKESNKAGMLIQSNKPAGWCQVMLPGSYATVHGSSIEAVPVSLPGYIACHCLHWGPQITLLVYNRGIGGFRGRVRNCQMTVFVYLLLKSYPKYKIDRDSNIAHDTDKNMLTLCLKITTSPHRR